MASKRGDSRLTGRETSQNDDDDKDDTSELKPAPFTGKNALSAIGLKSEKSTASGGVKSRVEEKDGNNDEDSSSVGSGPAEKSVVSRKQDNGASKYDRTEKSEVSATSSSTSKSVRKEKSENENAEVASQNSNKRNSREPVSTIQQSDGEKSILHSRNEESETSNRQVEVRSNASRQGNDQPTKAADENGNGIRDKPEKSQLIARDESDVDGSRSRQGQSRFKARDESDVDDSRSSQGKSRFKARDESEVDDSRSREFKGKDESEVGDSRSRQEQSRFKARDESEVDDVRSRKEQSTLISREKSSTDDSSNMKEKSRNNTKTNEDGLDDIVSGYNSEKTDRPEEKSGIGKANSRNSNRLSEEDTKRSSLRHDDHDDRNSSVTGSDNKKGGGNSGLDEKSEDRSKSRLDENSRDSFDVKPKRSKDGSDSDDEQRRSNDKSRTSSKDEDRKRSKNEDGGDASDSDKNSEADSGDIVHVDDGPEESIDETDEQREARLNAIESAMEKCEKIAYHISLAQIKHEEEAATVAEISESVDRYHELLEDLLYALKTNDPSTCEELCKSDREVLARRVNHVLKKANTLLGTSHKARLSPIEEWEKVVADLEKQSQDYSSYEIKVNFVLAAIAIGIVLSQAVLIPQYISGLDKSLSISSKKAFMQSTGLGVIWLATLLSLALFFVGSRLSALWFVGNPKTQENEFLDRIDPTISALPSSHDIPQPYDPITSTRPLSKFFSTKDVSSYPRLLLTLQQRRIEDMQPGTIGLKRIYCMSGLGILAILTYGTMYALVDVVHLPLNILMFWAIVGATPLIAMLYFAIDHFLLNRPNLASSKYFKVHDGQNV